MWKKKYFNEKKKTPPLEEHVAQLKSELEQIQRKTVTIIDAEAKHAAQTGYLTESEIGVRYLCVTFLYFPCLFLCRIFAYASRAHIMTFKIFDIKSNKPNYD